MRRSGLRRGLVGMAPRVRLHRPDERDTRPSPSRFLGRLDEYQLTIHPVVSVPRTRRFGYLVDLFKNRVENYVRRLCAARKPKRVLLCTIYYPEERASGSWADAALSLMRYDVDPGKLQCAIRQIFRHATSRVVVPGTEVVPVPLFEVLDARDGGDYEQRVEPSVVGGRKMAAAFHLRLQDDDEPSTTRR